MTIANFREIKISGGSSDKKWDADCDKSVSSDFDARDKMEEFKACKEINTWGPQPNVYPVVDTKIIPAKCDLTIWQQKRVLALIDKFTKKGWNYCHHHTPSWLPPDSQRVAIDPSNISGDGGSDGVCSAAGLSGDKKSGWNGIDCTHFTSWVYNYGFGAHLASLTGDQACGPNAPGSVVDLKFDSNNNYTNDEIAKLQPGDLLYIAKKSGVNPMAVSHGILWTGIKVQASGPFSEEVLLKNVPPSQIKAVQNDIANLKKNGKDLYIIADSHNAGPNYRIFAGWWRVAFTHARRLIGTKAGDSPSNHSFTNNVCGVTKK